MHLSSRMSKGVGVFVAAAVMLPMGLFTSLSPAGAVGGTSCKTASGTATFTPALPKITSATKVKSTIKITGAKLGGCVGGGVTSATFVATLKFSIGSNCKSLLAGASTGTKGTETITWNTKKTSTVALTLTGVTGKPTQTKATGPVSLGLFKGSKQSGTIVYTIPKGGCTTADLSKVTFKQLTPIVIK